MQLIFSAVNIPYGDQYLITNMTAGTVYDAWHILNVSVNGI